MGNSFWKIINTCLQPLYWLARPFLNRIAPDDPRYYLKRFSIITGLIGVLTILMAGLLFSLPRSTTFSYAGQSCIVQPLLFPGLITPSDSASFKPLPDNTISLAGLPIYSHRTCISLTKPTSQTETTSLQLKGLGFVRKTVRINPGQLPTTNLRHDPSKPVSTSEPISFTLSSPDTVMSYQLRAGAMKTDCTVEDTLIRCATTDLKLAHASSYQFSLQRSLKGQSAGTASSQTLSTVNAVTIAASSISTEQIVYDQPTSLSLTLNRPVISAGNVRLMQVIGDKKQELAATSEVIGAILVIKPAKPLPRSADIQLSVATVNAADGGYLTAPYSLAFKTSGGPKVTANTLGSSKVQPRSTFVLRFDSELSTSQPLSELIRVEADGKVVPTAVLANKNGASLQLPSLPACATFTIKVLDTLQNVHGVAGNNAWQFQSRMLCQTAFSIGTSVQGRSITAYKFGGGASSLLFVGATHGDEKSSAYILQSWVDYLEANPDAIPGRHSVTIIPILNPDGYAANKRTNANNVDLNRNFPSNNWKQSVVMPDKSTNPNGGGGAPLSEPESKALASYISTQNTRLALTYHAVGGVVIPNDAGDSVALARAYDSNSNLYFQPNSNTATIFEYDTTGSFEDWLRDKPGTPALLVEHATMTGNEFQRQVKAMRAMINL